MTPFTVKELINQGVEPAVLGRAAHKVQDWMALSLHDVWCKTPRFGWHKATRRELRLLGFLRPDLKQVC